MAAATADPSGMGANSADRHRRRGGDDRRRHHHPRHQRRPRRRRPPFIARWVPALDPLAAVSIAVVAMAVALAPRAESRIRAPAAFAAFAFGLSLAIGLGVNLARDGVHGWYLVFDTSAHGSFEAANEYLPFTPGPRRRRSAVLP